MIELRWLVRGSEKVLQYRLGYFAEGPYAKAVWLDWQDIPEVREGEG